MNGVFLVKIKINEISIWDISSRIYKHRRGDRRANKIRLINWVKRFHVLYVILYSPCFLKEYRKRFIFVS